MFKSGGILKNVNVTNDIPKIICSKFHPNRTMGKCSQSWERFGGKEGWELKWGGDLKKIANVTNSIPK